MLFINKDGIEEKAEEQNQLAHLKNISDAVEALASKEQYDPSISKILREGFNALKEKDSRIDLSPIIRLVNALIESNKTLTTALANIKYPEPKENDFSGIIEAIKNIKVAQPEIQQLPTPIVYPQVESWEIERDEAGNFKRAIPKYKK